MGQVATPQTPATLILTAVDRLLSSNSDGGLSPAASHIILLGENAGQNLGALSYVYATGAQSFAGGVTNVAYNGSVLNGGLLLPVFTGAVAPAVWTGPITAMGYNLFPAKTGRIGSLIAIGSNIGENFSANSDEVSGTVIIGDDALRYQRSNATGGFGFTESVFIGKRVMLGNAAGVAGDTARAWQTVVIGCEAMSTAGLGDNGSTASGNVVIGYRAAQNGASGNNTAFNNNVAIGFQCAQNSVAATSSVFVGSGISVTPSAGVAASNHVMVGGNISASYVGGASGNLGLGYGVSFSGVDSGNILIGVNANATALLAAASSHQLLVETGLGAKRTAIYGLLANASPGGLVFGNSDNTNRDIPGFNILKIIDGSKTGVAPVGGGFLYSVGGVLHWVDTGNGDTVIGGSSVISPAALGVGNNNDYAPGVGAVGTVRATVNGGGSTITGFAAGVAGKRFTIFNIAGAANLTLTNEDAASVAANRILTPNAAALAIRPQGSAVVWYDGTSARWRVEGQAA